MKTKSIGLFAVIMFVITLVNLKAEQIYSNKTTEIDISGNMLCSMIMPLMKKGIEQDQRC